MPQKAQGIGSQIARARLAVGLTQRELGLAVGQASRTVQAWESDSRNPRLPALERVALVTGRPVSWFFEREPDEVAA